MRAVRWMAALVLILALAGCASGKVPTMPDVSGKRLDVAKSDIKRAGFTDEIEVLGGGLLGVLKEQNWTVCEQLPQAGSAINEKPRLSVARSCTDPGGEPTMEASSAEPSATSTVGGSAPTDAAPDDSSIRETTVDKLLDKLNEGKSKAGDKYRFTGELTESDQWGTGASGDYYVMLKAKGGANDLMVFVDERDAGGWEDGTKVEMVVENVEVTIDGDTSDGWLRAKSVKVLP